MNDNEESIGEAGFVNALDAVAETPTQPEDGGNGELPSPVSNVAKRFAETPRQEQKEQATQVWNFLAQNEKDLTAAKELLLQVVQKQ
ncbi:predicted protein [Chaetoceros tenuissimus]|uniref:Uncharacterized protein n=1 Tax=Chaetoceros tenuissimus TaxID=426638 RepID=A0AAD3H5A1_9STRA|nr:predicted protein [Chaetoceros tenuissimus]